VKLDGRVSIVTGGGRGIGRAIALSFASEGARVVLAGSVQQVLDDVAGEIRREGGTALPIRADVSDEAAVEQMVAAALKEFGRIDMLVNNAGIIGPTAPVVRVDLEDWDHTLSVNLTGAFLCAKHALPSMIEQGSGRIINITSVAGLIGYALRSPYCVSKWGMIGLTRTLAEEVGAYAITANAIAPGPVRGPRIDEVIRRRATESGRTVEQVEREYVESLALKRMVEEDDIAAMALFLASDEARNITGETFEVSGGYRLG
jgi:NAD(P)-dependent dehydrogenase (short-subunit alcohol dehydrogenase family)